MKPCAVLPKWAQRSLDAALQLLDGLDHEKSVFPGLTSTFLLFVLRRGWESDDAVSSHLRFRERQPRMCRPHRLLKPFSWPFELNQHFSVVWLVFQQMAHLFLLSPFLPLFPLLWLYLFFPFVFSLCPSCPPFLCHLFLYPYLCHDRFDRSPWHQGPCVRRHPHTLLMVSTHLLCLQI